MDALGTIVRKNDRPIIRMPDKNNMTSASVRGLPFIFWVSRTKTNINHRFIVFQYIPH